jgi:hypothetical protein
MATPIVIATVLEVQLIPFVFPLARMLSAPKLFLVLVSARGVASVKCGLITSLAVIHPSQLPMLPVRKLPLHPRQRPLPLLCLRLSLNLWVRLRVSMLMVS